MIFLYRNYSYDLLLENWGLQSGKKLTLPIFCLFWSKFGPFWIISVKLVFDLGRDLSIVIVYIFWKLHVTALWHYFLVFKCDNECESLCKQSQKTTKECSIELGMRATKWNWNGQVNIALFEYSKVMEMWESYVKHSQK